MGDGSFSLDDLERLLGVPGRTIRYWSHEGLFPGPGAGRGTRYTDDHLARLFLIQKLRSEGRPIAEIKDAIIRLSAADVRALVEQAKAQPPKEAVPAKQLIRRWLRERDEQKQLPSPPSQVTEAAPSLSWTATSGAEGHWRRIPLSPGVELHVQHPLTRTSQALVDELIALARRLSKEHTR